MRQPALAAAPLTVRALEDVRDLLALEPAWRALHDAGAQSPFQSWEWASAWWLQAGEGTPWLLVAYRHQRVVAILPLKRSGYRGLPLRRVSFLTAPAADYQDLLAAPAEAAAAAAACWRHLAAAAPTWDLVDLSDVPADSALVTARPDGVLAAPHRVCPVIALAPTWEAQRGRISKSLRTQIGQRRRALERDFAVAIDEVDGAELPSALDELFWLHDRRWRRRGLSGAFADARVRRFHQSLAPRFAERGWLRLFRLRLDGKTRALFYCFARGPRVYYYLSGFDVALARWSLGTVLLAEIVARAIGTGAAELDLLRGDENYKRLWRAADTHTLRLVLGQRSWRARAALAVNWLERRAERAGSALRNRVFGHRRPKPSQATQQTGASSR